MKKLALCAVFVLVFACLFAQDEPNEQDVLQTARDKYQSSQTGNSNTTVTVTVDVSASVTAPPSESSQQASKTQEPEHITPFIIGFVPGIQIPFENSSISFGAFAIGGAVRNVYGFMGSGIFGIAQHIYGFQGAGIFNTADSVYGFQGAGIFNIANNLYGSQFSGIFNIAGNAERSVQLAGIFNNAGGTVSVQAAGIFNISDTVEGVQISAIFNTANKVSGIQIGLVNIAESVHGVQFGLVNISHDGVNTIGTSYEPDSRYLHLFWRNGSPALFALIQVGMPYTELFTGTEDPLCSAGLGTRIGSKNLYIDADISSVMRFSQTVLLSKELFTGDFSFHALNSSFTSARLSLGMRIAGMKLFIGYRYDLEPITENNIPEALRTGEIKIIDLFGTDYAVYRKWFVGVSL